MTQILIVEDNIVFCDSLAFDLEMRGYDVRQAYNGAAALAQLKAQDTPPDIILSDISMPDMDGYQLLAAVRNNEVWREIPFLFLTAHNSPRAVRTGKELGVDDYLVKPFEVDDLIVAMENKVRRIRDLRQGAEHRLDEMRQQFLNLISHELRTPLSPIVGGTQLLADSIAGTSDESIQELFGFVQDGVARLQRLLNNVLLYMELTGGNLESRFDVLAKDVPFDDVVREACRIVSADPGFVDKQVVLDLRCVPGPVLVRGIRNFLLALVGEPLRNAYTYSPVGGHVVLALRQDGANVTLTVTDQGPGIPVEQWQAVWKPFARMNQRLDQPQGMGLGLPIVHVAVHLHGGTCAIEPNEGTGACLTIRLPLVAD